VKRGKEGLRVRHWVMCGTSKDRELTRKDRGYKDTPSRKKEQDLRGKKQSPQATNGGDDSSAETTTWRIEGKKDKGKVLDGSPHSREKTMRKTRNKSHMRTGK